MTLPTALPRQQLGSDCGVVATTGGNDGSAAHRALSDESAPPVAPTAPRALAGIAFVVAACACFSTLDTATKAVTASVPLLLALWFRYAFQALATAAVALPLRGRGVWRTAHPGFQCLRGLLLLGCSLFAFLSLGVMPVAEFTAIVMVTPLVVTLLAARVLRQPVGRLRWALVVGGFVGTCVILRPGAGGAEAFGWHSLLPLGLVACSASFQVLTSRLARTEDALTTHLYTGWVGMLVASLALPFVWQPITSAWLWAGLCLMGAMGTVGHFLLILAYDRAPAATLTPFGYSQIGFALLGGWLVFAHVPDAWALAGMAAVAACGVGSAWLTLHESRRSSAGGAALPQGLTPAPDARI